MKIILLFFTLAISPCFAAIAPDSIANKVFHETGDAGTGAFRSHWEFSIIFDAGGRYSFIRLGNGSNDPPADGTYTYVRTGDAVATLTLKEPGGTLKWGYQGTGISPTAVSVQLTFASPSSGLDALGGVGTFALFDRDANLAAPAINVSLRSSVSSGRSMIAGFVIPGSGVGVSVDRDILIRVVGPGLAQFGLTGTWASPAFHIMKSAVANPFGLASSGSWTTSSNSIATFQKIFSIVGAFPLPSDSKDAVMVTRLSPGAYTILCDLAASDPGGEAIIEIYFLP